MSKSARLISDVESWAVELLIKKDGKFGSLPETPTWSMSIVSVRASSVDVGIFVAMYRAYP